MNFLRHGSPLVKEMVKVIIFMSNSLKQERYIKIQIVMSNHNAVDNIYLAKTKNKELIQMLFKARESDRFHKPKNQKHDV